MALSARYSIVYSLTDTHLLPGIKPETLSPVTSMFIDRYVRKTGQVNWTTEHVERVIEASQWEAEGSEEDHTLIMGKLTKEELARKKTQEKREGKKKGKNLLQNQPVSLPKSSSAPSHWLSRPNHPNSHSRCSPCTAAAGACSASSNSSATRSSENCSTPAYLERETELPFIVGWIFMAAATFESLPDKRPMLEAAKAVRREVVLGDEGIAAIRRLGELGFPIEFEADEECLSLWKDERYSSA